MKLRVGIWAGIGALVVVFWSLYIVGLRPSPFGALWALIDLTCPIALARRNPMSIYLVLLANAATYALIGLLVESIRRHHRRASPISN